MGKLRVALVLVLLAFGGCEPPGPPFATAAATIPPPAQGMARIFFYRWLEPYETTAPTTVSLNGKPAGLSELGTVLYRDVAPGQYTISVQSDEPYPFQFKTVVLEPGEVAFARIESLQSWSSCGGGGGGGDGTGGSVTGCRTTFVVVMMDPRVAQYEMRDLRFIRG
jgi:hypothetical protein